MGYYGVGDILEYELWGGDTRVVCVIHRSDNIKNGLPGFDGVVVAGEEKGQPVWGYDHQVIHWYAHLWEVSRA